MAAKPITAPEAPAGGWNILAWFSSKDDSRTALLELNGAWGVMFSESPRAYRLVESSETEARAKYKSQRDYARMTRIIRADVAESV